MTATLVVMMYCTLGLLLLAGGLDGMSWKDIRPWLWPGLGLDCAIYGFFIY